MVLYRPLVTEPDDTVTRPDGAPSPSDGGRPGRLGPIVLLAGPGDATHIVFHELDRRWPGVIAVVEEPASRVTMARRRAGRIGWPQVVGQILFVALAMPILARLGRRRVEDIISAAGFDVSPPAGPYRVASMNAPEARELLRRLRPAVAVVNGTRILSADTLAVLDCPVLNTHAGITPRYRGVHGGYWALAEGRGDLVGTTVHLVDPGIDTGGVLAQAVFSPGPEDSMATYPYLHLVAGVPALVEQVERLARGEDPIEIPPIDQGGASRLRYHPTLWGYLWRRIARGVR